MLALKVVLAIVLAYLIGAIPIGLIVAKLSKGVDVRDYGSGKTGSTNVLRTAGVKAGLL
ncbi:MAG: glycerol-3-phosphate acyltransferase, partial [Chloroflexi bacterium]|nr:glycerol-3-phosphate acyltransferase [Chloroflexota bacterium]